MDILSKSAVAPLDAWRNRLITGQFPGPRDHHDRYERRLGQEDPGPPGPQFRRIAKSILEYRVFPTTLIQAVKAPGPLVAGDIVGVRFVALPLVDLFFACRVLRGVAEMEEGRWCEGFVYQTLEGHPERGEERFAVEKELETGVLWGRLSSWSGPGLWLTRLGEPAVRRLQRYANSRALLNLQQIAEGRPENPAASESNGVPPGGL